MQFTSVTHVCYQGSVIMTNYLFIIQINSYITCTTRRKELVHDDNVPRNLAIYIRYTHLDYSIYLSMLYFWQTSLLPNLSALIYHCSSKYEANRAMTNLNNLILTLRERSWWFDKRNEKWPKKLLECCTFIFK